MPRVFPKRALYRAINNVSTISSHWISRCTVFPKAQVGRKWILLEVVREHTCLLRAVGSSTVSVQGAHLQGPWGASPGQNQWRLILRVANTLWFGPAQEYELSESDSRRVLEIRNAERTVYLAVGNRCSKRPGEPKWDLGKAENSSEPKLWISIRRLICLREKKRTLLD